MSQLDVHKRAVRLQPESLKRRGLSSFAEYVLTARKDRTPAVINPQRSLFHKVNPRGSTSCYVNFGDVAFRPFYRCSVQLTPRVPPARGLLGTSKGVPFFMGEA